MKNRILFILVFGLLFSCSKNDDQAEIEVVGKWKLVKMTGSTSNSETKGIDMEWQESYLLNENGTFQKLRETGESSSMASGTFKVISSSNETTIEFLYSNENTILGSCYSSTLTEVMVLSSNNMIYSTWSNCDGPGLEYKKVN